MESKNSNEYGSFPDLGPQPDESTDSLVAAMWCTAYCGVRKISRNDLRNGKKVITKDYVTSDRKVR